MAAKVEGSQIQLDDKLDYTTNKSTSVDYLSDDHQSTVFTNSGTMNPDTKNDEQQLIGDSNRNDDRTNRTNLPRNSEKYQPTRKSRDEGQQDNPDSYINALRIIKVISLLLIGACALAGMITSKVTFVSITSRMFNLYSAQDNETMINNQKSVVFSVSASIYISYS